MVSENSTFFAHEKLIAYRVALDFLGFCDGLLGRWPRGRAALAEQLRRASDSILLNIAEAAGQRLAGNSGANFFRTALGSAAECAAILDRVELLGVDELDLGRRQLRRITALLYGLLR